MAPDIASPQVLVGNVVTMDPRRPRAEAFAVADGVVVAVGSEAEARAALPGARCAGPRRRRSPPA